MTGYMSRSWRPSLSLILQNFIYVTTNLEHKPGKHVGLPVTSVTPVSTLKNSKCHLCNGRLGNQVWLAWWVSRHKAWYPSAPCNLHNSFFLWRQLQNSYFSNHASKIDPTYYTYVIYSLITSNFIKLTTLMHGFHKIILFPNLQNNNNGEYMLTPQNRNFHTWITWDRLLKT